jgi:hypothetical protein
MDLLVDIAAAKLLHRVSIDVGGDCLADVSLIATVLG